MAPHLDPINNDLPVSPANPTVKPKHTNFLVDPETGLPKFPIAEVAPSGIGDDGTTSMSLDDLQSMVDAVKLRLDAIEQVLPDDDSALAAGVQQNLTALQQVQNAITALQETAHDPQPQDDAIASLVEDVSQLQLLLDSDVYSIMDLTDTANRVNVFNWNTGAENDIYSDAFKVTIDPDSTAPLDRVVFAEGFITRVHVIGPLSGGNNVGGALVDVTNVDGELTYTLVEQMFVSGSSYLDLSYNDLTEGNDNVGAFTPANGAAIFSSIPFGYDDTELQEAVAELQQKAHDPQPQDDAITALQEVAHDPQPQDDAITALQEVAHDPQPQDDAITALQEVAHDPQPQDQAISQLQSAVESLQNAQPPEMVDLAPINQAITALQEVAHDGDAQDEQIELANNILDFVDFETNISADQKHQSVYRMLNTAPAGTTLSIDIAEFEPGEQITLINLHDTEDMLVQNSTGGFFDGVETFPAAVAPYRVPPNGVVHVIKNTGAFLTVTGKVQLGGQLIRLTNTNTTTDLNTPRANQDKIPLMGSVAINDGGYSVTNSDTIAVTRAGRYRVSSVVFVRGNAQRQAPAMQMLINDEWVGGISASAYIRDVSGHDKASNALAAQTFDLEAGDEIAVGTWETAITTGAVTMDSAGTSFIEVERIK